MDTHKVTVLIHLDPVEPAVEFHINAAALRRSLPKAAPYISEQGVLQLSRALPAEFQLRCHETLHDSAKLLFLSLQRHGDHGKLAIFWMMKHEYLDVLSRRNKTDLLIGWTRAICDMCEILDHDTGLDSSDALFRHMLGWIEWMFRELHLQDMEREQIELFFGLARIYRGTAKTYMRRLRGIWHYFEPEVRQHLLRRIWAESLAQGHEKALDRMYYALDNPQIPKNLGGFAAPDSDERAEDSS